MFLVAVALGFCVAGTVIGRDLSTGAARACSFAGLGMLLVQGLSRRADPRSPRRTLCHLEGSRRLDAALSYAVLGAVVISLLGLVFRGLGALNPLLTLLIFGLSALLIMVDFNYLRRHATEDDVVWLATGIFVSIVSIFISLLNLTSD